MDRFGYRCGPSSQEGRAPRPACAAAARIFDAREDRLQPPLNSGSFDMEVVLLWLDDLDDAVFCVALAWDRLRRGVLKVGLVSAILLAAAELSAIATVWSPAFSGVAAASVMAWLVGTLARSVHDREARRYLTAA